MKHYLDTTPAIKGLLGGLVVSPARGTPGAENESKTHGGFDNDPLTMNSVLFHFLGQKSRHVFEQRDLDY